VLVSVINNTEQIQVQVQCHWHGGHRSTHRVVRPVARADNLSSYPKLIAHIDELHKQGRSYSRIADILNEEGSHPSKQRETYDANMVRVRVMDGRRNAFPHRAMAEIG